MSFPCEAILSPGYYEARLHGPSGSTLASSILIQAVWPQFNLTLPSTHIAQDDIHPQLITTYVNKRVTCRASAVGGVISPFSLDVSITSVCPRHNTPWSVYTHLHVSQLLSNKYHTQFINCLNKDKVFHC